MWKNKTYEKALLNHILLSPNENQKNSDAKVRASTRVSALGPFVSKPYDSRYSTRKSCPTQRKDGKSRKRICISRYDWSAWMLSWLGEPSKSFKLWFQHNLKSHKTKLSYANAKQPWCLSNPFYWTNYDMDQRLTRFLISKSIELQWAMPRHPVLLPQPPIVLKPWSLESGALALRQLSSNIQNIQLSTFPTTHKHLQKTWNAWRLRQESLPQYLKMIEHCESASPMWTAAFPSADFQTWTFSLLPKLLHNRPRDNHEACLGCGLASNLFPTTSMLRICWRGLSFHWSTMH